MKRFLLLLISFFFNFFYTQTSLYLGNIPDLVFRKEAVVQPMESDTLDGHLMNYHFVKDTLKFPKMFKAHSKLNELTLFYASNKLGGENKIIFGKVGSTTISNKGIFDYGDSLMIHQPQAASSIITYAKKDQGASPFIFLSPLKDESILIPEFIVFKRNLSVNEKQRVETFLSLKYGISINYISEKNYLSSAGDILWNFKDNKKYGYRVTGIGRDDAFSLYQKQSTNLSSSLVTFSLETLKPLNQNNTGNLDDQQFILWGDNNQEVSFPEEDLLATSAYGDMPRKWKVQVKSDKNLTSNIYFNLKGLGLSQPPKLKLFRNNEGFSTGLAELFPGEKLNDSIYVFKNILWDSDHDKSDYFTLTNSHTNGEIVIASNCNELQNGTVKISLSDELLPLNYSLFDIKNNVNIIEGQQLNNTFVTFNNLSPGQYRIILHRPNLPDISKTFDLEGMTNQNIRDNYLWEGQPIELDVNYENYQYTLIKPNGSTIQYPPFLLEGLGDYTLKVKNKIGCEIQKQLHVLNQSDYDNIGSNSLFKEVKLYPNPSRDGVITVKIVLKAPKPITIQIYNSLGRLLKQATYNNTDNVLSTLSIPPIVGYYNVKIFIPEESKGYNLLIN